jgi:ankyrin repeat protein
MKEEYCKSKSKKEAIPPLLVAAKSKPVIYLRQLLDDKDIDPNSKDLNDWTALAHTARWGRRPIVQALLADPRVEPDMRNNKRQTPLIPAAEHGHYGATKLLLGTKGVDAAAVDDDKWNALPGAAWNEHAPCGTALDR